MIYIMNKDIYINKYILTGLIIIVSYILYTSI